MTKTHLDEAQVPIRGGTNPPMFGVLRGPTFAHPLDSVSRTLLPNFGSEGRSNGLRQLCELVHVTTHDSGKAIERDFRSVNTVEICGVHHTPIHYRWHKVQRVCINEIIEFSQLHVAVLTKQSERVHVQQHIECAFTNCDRCLASQIIRHCYQLNEPVVMLWQSNDTLNERMSFNGAVSSKLVMYASTWTNGSPVTPEPY